MERENMKGKIALTVIGAATLLVALAGATFAYFSATDTADLSKVTTASLTLKVETDGTATHVSDIKPTNWTNVTDAATNSDIAKIPFKVTSDSTVDGFYTVNLQTTIALKEKQTQVDGTEIELEGGKIGDIKYKLYTKDGSPVIEEAQSFAENTDVKIITNKKIDAGEGFSDEYILYVYIQNDPIKPQNQLQEVEFTITLKGSANQAVQQ